jgi:hypothetical protein
MKIKWGSLGGQLGIAYCQKYLQNGEKLLVGLHTDTRAAFIGGRLNPMVRVPLDCVVDDEETDDTEDLVPATGGSGMSAEAAVVMMSLLGGAALGTGLLVRRRFSQA